MFAEYTGEGTVWPMMIIRRGPWKYVTCPADEPQFFNLEKDPYELNDLAAVLAMGEPQAPEEEEVMAVFDAYDDEAKARWDFDAITAQVPESQRSRRVIWDALRKGAFTSWDFDPVDDGRVKYVSS